MNKKEKAKPKEKMQRLCRVSLKVSEKTQVFYLKLDKDNNLFLFRGKPARVLIIRCRGGHDAVQVLRHYATQEEKDIS